MKAATTLLVTLSILAGLPPGRLASSLTACPHAADTSCEGYPTLEVVRNTGALCSDLPTAHCSAVEFSHDSYDQTFGTLWGSGDPKSFCSKSKQSVAARDLAAAVAGVWTSAKSRVSCETTCGYRFSRESTEQQADVVAEAIAQAAARVVSGSKAQSVCYADLRALSAALAEGTVVADHEVCEGSSASWEGAYAQAVTSALEDALAEFASAECGFYPQIRHLAAAPLASICNSQALGDVCASRSNQGGLSSLVSEAGRHNPHVSTDLRPCKNAPDTSCSAFAKLEIQVTYGKCWGTASASCKTVTSSENAYEEKIKEWVSDPSKLCDSGTVQATAEAIGTAIAKVWAEAAAKVTCSGQGFACGWSASGGEAWSIAFAESLARATAVADSAVSKGMCYSDIRAVGSAIATAAAAAQADACTRGKTVEDFQSSFAESVTEVVASSIAAASASACSKTGETSADSTCTGDAESLARGKPYHTGDACAGLEQIKACIGQSADMCCAKWMTKKKCNCKNAGCSDGPWKRLSEYGERTYRSWSDKKGNLCYCYNR